MIRSRGTNDNKLNKLSTVENAKGSMALVNGLIWLIIVIVRKISLIDFL